MTRGPLTTAALDTLGAPRLWAIGLAGFLARGGIVLFALPVIVLPSVVGLTTFIGPNSVTAAGLAPRFVALSQRPLRRSRRRSCWVPSSARPPSGPSSGRSWTDAPRRPAGRGARPARLRWRSWSPSGCVALVPLGLAIAIGGARLGQVGYQELILPSDSTAPFVVRVLLAAPEAVAVVIVGWLVSELIAAVAVRLALLDRRGIPGALGGALVWIVRRPVRSLAVLIGTTIGSLVVVGPVLVVCTIAWSGVRTALLGPTEPTAALAWVALFVAAWIGGLVLAGLAATWRSVAWSLVVLGDHRGGGPPAIEGGTL